LATVNKPRPQTAESAKRRNRAHKPVAAGFDPGSLEHELSAIGRTVPARAWAKLPADYFANLDHYLDGAPKKK
jgi:hypothetical protein